MFSFFLFDLHQHVVRFQADTVGNHREAGGDVLCLEVLGKDDHVIALGRCFGLQATIVLRDLHSFGEARLLHLKDGGDHQVPALERVPVSLQRLEKAGAKNSILRNLRPLQLPGNLAILGVDILALDVVVQLLAQRRLRLVLPVRLDRLADLFFSSTNLKNKSSQ